MRIEQPGVKKSILKRIPLKNARSIDDKLPIQYTFLLVSMKTNFLERLKKNILDLSLVLKMTDKANFDKERSKSFRSLCRENVLCSLLLDRFS